MYMNNEEHSSCFLEVLFVKILNTLNMASEMRSKERTRILYLKFITGNEIKLKYGFVPYYSKICVLPKEQQIIQCMDEMQK